MCGFQYICRVLWSSSDTELKWSIGRINCFYHSTRVDLYNNQILLYDHPYASEVTLQDMGKSIQDLIHSAFEKVLNYDQRLDVFKS